MRQLILKPLELAYQTAAGLRRSLHRRGFLKSRRLPRPVISIGNRSFGGSGKTPFVVTLCRRLQQEGWKVCILSRGYRRQDESSVRLVVEEDPWTYGDEPVLLSRRLPGVDVMVGRDRYQAGVDYLTRRNCDLFILDDGFQHLALERDLDILLETGERGLQREGPSALSSADFVLQRAAGEGKLMLVPTSVVCGSNRYAPSWLEGKEVVAFAGLAENERFFQTLRSLGAVIADTIAFEDHHRYTPGDADRLRRLRAARNAQLLVTTEKDWVKVRDDDISYLEVEMIVPAAVLDEIVERARLLLDQAR